MFAGIVCRLAVIIAEAKARKQWIESLPKDEADRVRAEDSRIARENELHRRAVEIAEAGRARNFWGK